MELREKDLFSDLVRLFFEVILEDSEVLDDPNLDHLWLAEQP